MRGVDTYLRRRIFRPVLRFGGAMIRFGQALDA
jgi:hypothetical protein